jgi:nickel-dependent lactate racemase
MVNVTLNIQKEITSFWVGDYRTAHEEGCQFVAGHAVQQIDELVDVVITSNSGYPLDQNLYQAVKGMSAAARIVKPGGAIIAAAECSDGLPDHGNFKGLLKMKRTPQELLAAIQSPGFSQLDQWQAQTQALIGSKASLYLYSTLADSVVRESLIQPTHDIAATLAELLAHYGPGARVAVLPEGPQTVPTVREKSQSQVD